MLKRIFPFQSMGLDTLSVFLKRDQMGYFMYQRNQELILVRSRIDCNEVFAVGQLAIVAMPCNPFIDNL